MVGNTRQDFTTMQTYHGDGYCISHCDSGEVKGRSTVLTLQTMFDINIHTAIF